MPEQQKSNRGGSGRGQGRKPVKQGEETVTVSLRMTPEQRAKLARLGGAEWVLAGKQSTLKRSGVRLKRSGVRLKGSQAQR